jgi:hypothetical protein
MPAHELLVHAARHALEVAGAALLQEQRQEVDLEEQVAELVDELLVVVALRRVGDLVRLLDRVRDDRPRRLLAVPRALGPQPLGQSLQVDERRRKRLVIQLSSRASTSSSSPSGTDRPAA